MQSESQQRPYKVSFNIGKEKAKGVSKALSECLAKRGKFGDGKQPRNTLVCGDSGNDSELFSVPDVYGVMVSNAMEELLQWHTENGVNNPKIFHATKRCASGIIQAIGHFKLGPNLSPRDGDFPKSSLPNTNPGHEIVKFYLSYERWRRADIASSEQYIPNLKAIFVCPV
ncbi:hypothetical protein MKW94_021502 [Papaver nudicaule]|uniref:Sucrose-phosphatase n=1 Tax=Papaver nudicaule TaxID=74823 RepID=A0AA41V600_PAPNU|nr:hypothetical protein [Papaver nudicaule]